MECIFGYHRDVKLLLLSMIPISFCLFFPSSRENLNPLRYILAGGMFCLFTHVKTTHKKERGESVVTLRMGMVLSIKKVSKRLL